MADLYRGQSPDALCPQSLIVIIRLMPHKHVDQPGRALALEERAFIEQEIPGPTEARSWKERETLQGLNRDNGLRAVCGAPPSSRTFFWRSVVLEAFNPTAVIGSENCKLQEDTLYAVILLQCHVTQESASGGAAGVAKAEHHRQLVQGREKGERKRKR
jgi:hypothetical protein